MARKCKLPYCDKCNGIYKLLVIVVFVIILYFIFLSRFFEKGNPSSNDVLNKKLIDLSFLPGMDGCCSFWPISHFILYFILGLLFPDCFVILMLMGVAWEGFEVFADKYFERRKYKNEAGNIQYSDGWWGGSTVDLMMNFLGFVCGWFLAKKLGWKICLKYINQKTKYCLEK